MGRLALVDHPGQREARDRFAAVALSGLATVGPDLGAGPDLALQLGLSAWMRLAGVGLAEAATVLAELRRAVLVATGLEHSGEPIPFRVPDPRQDVLLLAGYLGDLLGRAAAATGSDRPAIVARVLGARSA